MDFQFWITSDRVPVLLREMPKGKVQVLKEEEDGTTKVSVEILHGTDALYLFHAGIHHGLEAMTPKVAV